LSIKKNTLATSSTQKRDSFPVSHGEAWEIRKHRGKEIGEKDRDMEPLVVEQDVADPTGGT